MEDVKTSKEAELRNIMDPNYGKSIFPVLFQMTIETSQRCEYDRDRIPLRENKRYEIATSFVVSVNRDSPIQEVLDKVRDFETVPLEFEKDPRRILHKELCTKELGVSDNVGGQFVSLNEEDVSYDFKRSIQIVKFPKILRITVQLNPGKSRTLDLSDKDGLISLNNALGETKDFKLYGVVYKHGGRGGGHYTALVRDIHSNREFGSFYNYDDSSSSKVETEKLGARLKDNKSYILYYYSMDFLNQYLSAYY